MSLTLAQKRTIRNRIRKWHEAVEKALREAQNHVNDIIAETGKIPIVRIVGTDRPIQNFTDGLAKMLKDAELSPELFVLDSHLNFFNTAKIVYEFSDGTQIERDLGFFLGPFVEQIRQEVNEIAVDLISPSE